MALATVNSPSPAANDRIRGGAAKLDI